MKTELANALYLCGQGMGAPLDFVIMTHMENDQRGKQFVDRMATSIEKTVYTLVTSLDLLVQFMEGQRNDL